MPPIRSSQLGGLQLHVVRDEGPLARVVAATSRHRSRERIAASRAEAASARCTTFWRVVVVITLLEVACVSVPLLVTSLRLTAAED
jgi:hypothetical protein